MSELLQKNLNKGMTYSEYRDRIHQLWSEGKTTGTNQSEERLEYAKLNIARMKRVENTELIPELLTTLQGFSKKIHVLILTEGWCGDSAQTVPLLSIIEKINPLIHVRYFLRDENDELMNAYLTNGGRSIPKVIVADENGIELFTWGSRPAACQTIMEEMKSKGASKPEKEAAIHAWYAKDKTRSFQNEILDLFKTI